MKVNNNVLKCFYLCSHVRTFPVVHFSSLLEECVTVSPARCVLEMEVDSIECVFFVHLFIKSIIRELQQISDT